MQTLPRILSESVRRYADRPALRMHGAPDERAYTYARLGCAAAATADRLAEQGVARGTPVALLGDSGPDWVVAYFGLHLRGAVCVPIDPLLAPGEIQSILRRSRPLLFVVSNSLRETAQRALGDLPSPAVIALEELLDGLNDLRRPQGGGADALAAAAEAVQGDDPALIVFTSGTMGRGKGVVLTHRNVASNAVAAAEWLGVGPEDRFLSILPLNHMFEQTGGLLAPLASGASITYAGSHNPRVLVAAMQQSGITLATMVPGIVRLLHKQIASTIEALPPWRQWVFRRMLALSRAGQVLGLNLGRRLFRKAHLAFGGRCASSSAGGRRWIPTWRASSVIWACLCCRATVCPRPPPLSASIAWAIMPWARWASPCPGSRCGLTPRRAPQPGASCWFRVPT